MTKHGHHIKIGHWLKAVQMFDMSFNRVMTLQALLLAFQKVVANMAAILERATYTN